MYLPLCKVADTPFHIQGDDVQCLQTVIGLMPFFLPQASTPIAPTKDNSCQCLCKVCDEGHTHCPATDECFPNEGICDGVVDCPDVDEIGCGERFIFFTNITLTVSYLHYYKFCNNAYIILCSRRNAHSSEVRA